jgi:hypothetical protein
MDGSGICRRTWRREAFPHHGFDPRPETRVAFALHVAGSKHAVNPGSLRALDWIFPVIGEVIPQNFCLRGISGRDLRPAVDDAMGLIKIDGLGDIVGNNGIVLPDLGDAIHLHRQQNRYARSAQFASEQHCGRCSPALAEQDNSGAGFFFGGESAVAVGIEQPHDGIKGPLPAPVFENSDVSVFGNDGADSLRQPNRAVVRVVVADEAAHKTDDDVGSDRSVLRAERGGVQRSRDPWQAYTKNRCGDDEGTKWNDPGHADSNQSDDSVRPGDSVKTDADRSGTDPCPIERDRSFRQMA